MLEAIVDDLCQRKTDVIVCACGPHVHHGSSGGLAQAIEQAAGPSLKEFCEREELSADYGQVLWSPPGDMFSKEIAHAVGPRWLGGDHQEREALAQVHKTLVRETIERGYQSLSLPAISCGIFGFPPSLAAPIAVSSVREALAEQESDIDITWVFLDGALYPTWQRALSL